MNRFSITKVQMTMNDKKYKGAMSVPHVFFGIHYSEVSMVSYIILFQSSPVETLSNIIIANPKLLKLVYLSMISPSLMLPNTKTPSTAKMKKINIRSENTFNREGREKVIV
jgi:hypothetical protein